MCVCLCVSEITSFYICFSEKTGYSIASKRNYLTVLPPSGQKWDYIHFTSGSKTLGTLQYLMYCLSISYVMHVKVSDSLGIMNIYV